MNFIRHLFNYLGINCFLRGHDWMQYKQYKGCKRCPAIKIGEEEKTL